MTHDFVDGVLGCDGARRAIPFVGRVISLARDRGVPVIYLQDAHHPDDFELRLWGPHAMAGSKGCETVAELKPHPTDKVFLKRCYDGFLNSELFAHLKGFDVDRLILTGVSTDICVQVNCGAAFFRGLESVVVREATGALDDSKHEGALDAMTRIFGAKVASIEELPRIMRPAAPRAAMGSAP